MATIGIAWGDGVWVVAAWGVNVWEPGTVFLVPFDVDADDDSFVQATGIIGADTDFDAVVFCQGLGSWNFSGSNLTNGTVTYENNSLYAFTGTFIVRGKLLFTDLSSDPQVIISFYEHLMNHRSWHFQRSGDNFVTFWSDDGSDAAPAQGIIRAVPGGWELNRWYDLVASRDASDDIRMYLDGVQLGAEVNIPFDMHFSASVGPLRLGGLKSTTPQVLSGNLDEWSITTGDFINANFTPSACIDGGGSRRQRQIKSLIKSRRRRR